jgi:uncharacterized protein
VLIYMTLHGRLLVALAAASNLLLAPMAVAAENGASPMPNRSSSKTENSRLLDSSDFVHIAAVKRSMGNADQLTVTLRVDDGFHINANPATLPYLIPTSIAFVGVTPVRIVYPAPSRFNPKFSDELLDVYDGTISIIVLLPKDSLAASTGLRGNVTAQACTDTICLPPAELAIDE